MNENTCWTIFACTVSICFTLLTCFIIANEPEACTEMIALPPLEGGYLNDN